MKKEQVVRLKETYEDVHFHETWESVYRNNPLQDKFNAKILDRTITRLQPRDDALFLDAGCGVGYHTLAIAGKGYQCVGVDISETILRVAKKNLAESGLGSRASFDCQCLEDLPFPDGHFDVVHCRGALMHIPDWERALQELCRVLRPGGRIFIMESNARSFGTQLVRLARLLRKSSSELITTPGGLEFWSKTKGMPFVVRVADERHLREALRKHGVERILTFAAEFWDINRFPRGVPRDLAIRFNSIWFSLRLPALLSMGNATIGTKAMIPLDTQRARA